MWRRLAAYSFLDEELADRRVLEIGSGTGEGARLLANRGAAEVLGVDDRARMVDEARQRHRQTNLEFRHERYAALEIEDDTFDVVAVAASSDILRRPGVLAELRRVLRPGGTLIAGVTSADRAGARGGMSYDELVGRLSPQFAPVTVVCQAPFTASALVEFGDGEEVDIEVDTSLAGLGGPALDYVAVCGRRREPRPYSLVALPSAAMRDEAARSDAGGAVFEAEDTQPEVEGGATEALRVELERALAESQRLRDQLAAAERVSRPPTEVAPTPSASERIANAFVEHVAELQELEDRLAESRAYAVELEGERAEVEAERDRAEGRATSAEERCDELRAELVGWRRRCSQAEGEVLAARREIDDASDDRASATGTADRGGATDAKAASAFEAAAADLLAGRGVRDAEGPLGEDELRRVLSVRETEIMLLNAGVSALRDRFTELAEALRDVIDALPADLSPERREALDRIAADLARYGGA